MFCVTSIVRTIKSKKREECETRRILSDERKLMPIYKRDNERIRDDNNERYKV